MEAVRYTSNMDHISLVLVNYNSERDTLECLQSLQKIKAKGFEYQILIIDNGSKEPLTIPSDLSRKVELVRSESNLGFTGGNNLGIKYALDTYNSDFILLLNNDTYVDPHFLQALYDSAKVHPEQGLICPKIYFAKGNEYHKPSYKPEDKGLVLWYAGGSIDWPNVLCFHRGVDELDRGHFDTQLTSDFATGCCVLARREVLEKIGVFDERFFLYLEDVDLSLRTQQAGFSIGFCSAAQVWHKNAGSSGGSGSPLHQYYQTRNRLLFAFKHGKLKTKLVMTRFLIGLFISGAQPEKMAVLDFLQNRFGKRVVV